MEYTMNQDLNIVNAFSSIKDHRVNRNKLHNLIDIIVVSICAVMCKAEGWEDIEDFGNERHEWLKTFLELPNGIPSHDTIRRVFEKIDINHFQECMMRWTSNFFGATEGKFIAIDGKTLRRSFDYATGNASLHLVQAFATDTSLMLAQCSVDKKENEITKIPELLDMLSITGAIVTIDAIGCQKKIAEKIVNSNKADYVLALKDNHPNLRSETASFFRVAGANKFEGFAHDVHEDIDAGHGRIETRKCTCLSTEKWMDYVAAEWTGLKTMVKIESKREIGDKTTTETRYYITSLPADAKLIATAIRSHWGIENTLHWTLDVTFREDLSRIRKCNAPENFAIMRRAALSITKRNKPSGISIKKAQFKALMNPQFASKLLFGI